MKLKQKLSQFFNKFSSEQKGQLAGGTIATVVGAGALTAGLAIGAAPIALSAVVVGGFVVANAAATASAIAYNRRKAKKSHKPD